MFKYTIQMILQSLKMNFFFNEFLLFYLSHQNANP
jgi:hypothetical protein